MYWIQSLVDSWLEKMFFYIINSTHNHIQTLWYLVNSGLLRSVLYRCISMIKYWYTRGHRLHTCTRNNICLHIIIWNLKIPGWRNNHRYGRDHTYYIGIYIVTMRELQLVIIYTCTGFKESAAAPFPQSARVRIDYYNNI